jgi:hypothetical protein
MKALLRPSSTRAQSKLSEKKRLPVWLGHAHTHARTHARTRTHTTCLVGAWPFWVSALQLLRPRSLILTEMLLRRHISDNFGDCTLQVSKLFSDHGAVVIKNLLVLLHFAFCISCYEWRFLEHWIFISLSVPTSSIVWSFVFRRRKSSCTPGCVERPEHTHTETHTPAPIKYVNKNQQWV